MTKKRKLIIGAIVLVVIVGLGIKLGSSNNAPSHNVAPTKGLYAALGDSVAAGVGLKDYSDASACDRTKQAYPNLVATKLNYKLESVACSSATTQNGLLGVQDVNQLSVASQLDTILLGNKPSLISMTIGANDANWTTFIQKCYTSVCGSAADTSAVNAGLAKASINLDQALTQIKNKYSTSAPDVLLTGYYRLFPTAATANCTEMTGLEPAELAWIQQLQDGIDSSLKTVAAKYDFAKFVPINFAGHELCTDDSWVQGLGSKAPYHPTEAGQAAIAQEVVHAVGKPE